MGRAIPVIAIIDFVIFIAALYDCVTTDRYAVQHLPKIVWVIIILVFEGIGGVFWFAAGRPSAAAVRARQGTWAPGNGFPEYERPPAPDDDPAFLADLAAERRRQAEKDRREDEERLRKWEASLREREERLRRDDEPPRPAG